MQTVPELVEQRQHVVVRQQRRLAPYWRREVADQVSHWRLDAVARASPRDRFVHPRTAALRVARVGVEIELTNERIGGIGDAEEPHRWMPRLGAVRLDVDPIERLD